MSSEHNAQVRKAQEAYLASLGNYSHSSPPPLLQPQATSLGRAARKCQSEQVLSPSPALVHIQGPWQVTAP